MKKPHGLLAMLIFVIALSGCGGGGGGGVTTAPWQVVGSAGFSAGKVEFVSLAIDGNGVPYVAYRDEGNGNRATVMKYAP